MPDPYWDDVAEKAAESRARGQNLGKEAYFPSAREGGACDSCGTHMPKHGVCKDCLRKLRGSVNGVEE